MSVGTIVTIVLLMTVLVLGIFLVQRIFTSSQSAIDLTDQQLRTELENLFTDDDKMIAIYPDPNRNKPLEIKQGEHDEIGIAIRNLGRLGEETKTYSYVVEATQVEPGCSRLKLDKINENSKDGWIGLGGRGENIVVREGSISPTERVTIRVPPDAPLCTVNFRVKVFEGGSQKEYENFKIKSVP